MAKSTVLLYELTCSGGLPSAREEMAEDGALIREGRAMLGALAADFAAIDGVETLVMRDARRTELEFPECEVLDIDSAAERVLLIELSRKAAGTVVIAPEIDGLLDDRYELVEKSGGRLICPSWAVANLATDKQRTAEHLQKHGVRAPHGVLLYRDDPLPPDFRYPAVLKPVDGCGSHDVWLVRDSADTRCLAAPRWAFPMRLEEFVPGIAASVAVLCGPKELRALAPCRQRLSDDGRFQYLGGELPLPLELAKRAQDLAVRAVATLPAARGYIGVDLVLGDDPGGSGDAVIEINPRLTTSYIGLRAAATCNLAEAMWAIAEGRAAEVVFGEGSVAFDSDGTVRRF